MSDKHNNSSPENVGQTSDEDRLLDAYLAGDTDITAFYRQSQSTETPTETADLAVLAAAKRSVASGPKALPLATMRRWKLPLSVAATLVLSTSLYLVNQPLLQAPDQVLEETDPSYGAERPAAVRPLETPATEKAKTVLRSSSFVDADRQPTPAAIAADAAATASELPPVPEPLPQPMERASATNLQFAAPMQERSLAGDAVGAETADPVGRGGVVESSDRSDAKIGSSTTSTLSKKSGIGTGPLPSSESAEEWLKVIGELVARNEHDQALVELKRFLSHHPDTPLPLWAEALLDADRQRN